MGGPIENYGVLQCFHFTTTTTTTTTTIRSTLLDVPVHTYILYSIRCVVKGLAPANRSSRMQPTDLNSSSYSLPTFEYSVQSISGKPTSALPTTHIPRSGDPPHRIPRGGTKKTWRSFEHGAHQRATSIRRDRRVATGILALDPA